MKNNEKKFLPIWKAACTESAFCWTDIDDCVNNSCQNNATCVDHVNGYTCNCSAGFTGTYCETGMNSILPRDDIYFFRWLFFWVSTLKQMFFRMVHLIFPLFQISMTVRITRAWTMPLASIGSMVTHATAQLVSQENFVKLVRFLFGMRYAFMTTFH